MPSNYSSYAPLTLPKMFWPDPDIYARVAEQMRARGITPPPIGTLDPQATAALGKSLYEQEGFLDDPAHIAAIVMGGAAAGGAFGGGFGGGAGAGGGFSGGFVPTAGGGGVGASIAKMGVRTGIASLLSRGGGGGGTGGGGMATGGSLLEQIAAQMFEQTDPLRQALIARSGKYLTGGVGASPQFSAFKAAAEPQYAQARDEIIGATPAGGALTAALADLQAKKARAMTEARGGIDQQELGLATQLATGQTGAAMTGLGTAGSLSNQRDAIAAQTAQAESAQEAAILAALGQGAGAYFGSKD